MKKEKVIQCYNPDCGFSVPHLHEVSVKKERYFRIFGKEGTYIFTETELKVGLDRENLGIKEKVLKEKDLY